MLKIEITESSDFEIIGTHVFFKKVISIGRSKTEDLIIFDQDIELHHLEIQQVQNGILISNKASQFFHTNGKKVSGKKLHRINDTVKIGNTEFKITEYSPWSMDNKDSFEERYDKLTHEKPQFKHLLRSLENELVRLEEKIHNEE